MASRLLIPRVPITVSTTSILLPRRAPALSSSHTISRPCIVASPLHHLSSTIPRRTMSSTEAPRKFEWLVVIPDFPGVQEKRIQVRPLHFAGLKPMLESGTFQMGGAILNEVPKDDQPSSLDFAGSTVVAIAESKEEVLEILKNDVYAKEGVWDISKVQMWPLKCAFRIPIPGQMQ